MPASFYVFRRTSRSPFFQAKFLDERGRVVATRSTGEKKRNQALLRAAEMERSGLLPSGPGAHRSVSLAQVTDFAQVLASIKEANLTPEQVRKLGRILESRDSAAQTTAGRVGFVDWLSQFWDWDASDYIREKLALGHRLTQGYCLTNYRHVENHYRKHFGELTLAEVDRLKLKEFFLRTADLKLSSSSINSIMNCSKVALTYAWHNGLIAENPAEGLSQVRRAGNKRGILTRSEIVALQAVRWQTPQAAVGFLTALTCGLRMGEVLGLRVEDIGESFLSVKRQWSNSERVFRETKSKSERQVPLLKSTRQALVGLAEQNPFDDGLVFWGLRSEGRIPCDQKVLVEGFYRALKDIGIDETCRAKRGLVFHGLRHFYAVVLVDQVEARKVALATGHTTAKMTERYADHQTEEHLAEVATALVNVFDFVSSAAANLSGEVTA